MTLIFKNKKSTSDDFLQLEMNKTKKQNLLIK